MLSGLVGICRKQTEPQQLRAAPGPRPGPCHPPLPARRSACLPILLGSGPSRALILLPHWLEGGAPCCTLARHIPCLPPRGYGLCDQLPANLGPPAWRVTIRSPEMLRIALSHLPWSLYICCMSKRQSAQWLRPLTWGLTFEACDSSCCSRGPGPGQSASLPHASVSSSIKSPQRMFGGIGLFIEMM